MKRLVLVSAVLALFVGCRHASPYDYGDNWLIREDAVRPRGWREIPVAPLRRLVQRVSHWKGLRES